MGNYCLVLIFEKAGNGEKLLDKFLVTVDMASWSEGELPVLHEKSFSFRASAD